MYYLIIQSIIFYYISVYSSLYISDFSEDKIYDNILEVIFKSLMLNINNIVSKMLFSYNIKYIYFFRIFSLKV